MQRTKVEANLERQFLTAMVTSKQFMVGAAPLLTDIALLDTRYVQQVAQWCLDHWTTYALPPGKSITAIYHAWVANTQPADAEASAVHDFLESLSNEYDTTPTVNAPYLLDELTKYLTGRKLLRLAEQITGSLQRGEQLGAVQAVTDWRGVTQTAATGYNPLRGRDVVAQTYATSVDGIIDMPKASNWFWTSALSRAALIGLMGPEKRGKTYWAIEFAIRALYSRLRVAFFEVGDLTARQVNQRIDSRLAQVPLLPREVDFPIALSVQHTKGSKSQAIVQHTRIPFGYGLDAGIAMKAHKLFHRKHQLDRAQPHIMVSVHPNSSINVAGIDSILTQWEQELGFVADVNIIDYPDILAPEQKRQDFRHQVDETWRALRRLSQTRQQCIICPTQAAATSYTAHTMTMSNFSEDKRKLSHVTGLLGLNQIAEEKRQQVMRLNWLLRRDDDYDPMQCLWVAQCLPFSMAMVRVAR